MTSKIVKTEHLKNYALNVKIVDLITTTAVTIEKLQKHLRRFVYILRPVI